MSKLLILSWSPICTLIQHLLRKSIPGVFLFTVCQSKQTLWNQVWKKEFAQTDVFVQKAGNKIVIDISLALSIFRNSFKVRLINMALIAEVCRKRVWLVSGDSSSNIQMVTFNLSDCVKSKIFGALLQTPLGGLTASPTDPPSATSPVFLFFRVGKSAYVPN